MTNCRCVFISLGVLLAVDLAVILIIHKLVFVTALHGVTAVFSYGAYVVLKSGRTNIFNQVRLGLQPNSGSENKIVLFAALNFLISILLAFF